MRFFSWLALGALMIICHTAWATMFLIKKGDHGSSPPIVRVFKGTHMNFSAAFDESARYTFEGSATSDQGDTNKLYGFSDCSTDHMQNSARFGWYWMGDQLHIMAFVHRQGQFYFKKMGVADLGRVYDYEIALSDNRSNYVFRFGGKEVEMLRGCTDRVAMGYHSGPYFGGQQVAPHDIRILVDLKETVAAFSVGRPYPNPVTENRFMIDVSVYDDLVIGFRIVDMMGRELERISPRAYSAGSEERIEITLNRTYVPGVYLVVPFATDRNGREQFGFLREGTGRDKYAYRILIQ